MRGALFILIAMPFTTGCNLVQYMAFNAVNEPATRVDTKSIAHRAEKLALDAWLDHLTHLPDSCPPDSYKEGFHEGYKDYLLHGGSGAPPAVPPVKYRRKKNLSPEGQLEVRAYFGGFAEGAKMAKASGYRAFFVIPVSSPMPPEQRTGYDEVGKDKQKAKKPGTEELPVPRQIPDKDPMQSQIGPGASVPVRETVNVRAQQQNPAANVQAQRPLFSRPVSVEAPQLSPFHPIAAEPRQPAPFQPIPVTPSPVSPFQPIPAELPQVLPSPFVRDDTVEPPPESQFRPLPPLAPELILEITPQILEITPQILEITPQILEITPETPFAPSPPTTNLPREFNVPLRGGPATR